MQFGKRHLLVVWFVFGIAHYVSGTRESAFVHAISSAGVAHALTRACSSGELENCGCDRSLKGKSPQGFQVPKLKVFNLNVLMLNLLLLTL